MSIMQFHIMAVKYVELIQAQIILNMRIFFAKYEVILKI